LGSANWIPMEYISGNFSVVGTEWVWVCYPQTTGPIQPESDRLQDAGFLSSTIRSLHHLNQGNCYIYIYIYVLDFQAQENPGNTGAYILTHPAMPFCCHLCSVPALYSWTTEALGSAAASLSSQLHLPPPESSRLLQASQSQDLIQSIAPWCLKLW
jgi:hypothetical protein